MTVRKTILAATVLAAAVGAFSLLRMHDQAAAARARIETAEARRMRAVSAAHDSSARLRAVREAKRALVPPPPPSAESAKRAQTGPDTKALAKWFDAQAKDPKAQIAQLAVAKIRLHQKFEPFYRKLRLSAEKIAALDDVEAAHDEKVQDIYSAAVAEHVANDDPATIALYTQAAKERTASEKAILGDEGYAQLETYRRTLPIQEFVAGFDGLATVSGEPLNEAQKQQLIAAIGSAIPDFASKKQPYANMLDVDWSRVDNAAVAILSPAQLELLQSQDPPGSTSGAGRFWSTLNKALNQAMEAETKAGSVTATAQPTP